jgi:hypothetical protein
MAHFAELDVNNTVLRVLVTDNDDPNGDEGYQWLVDNLGGTWKKTSFNTFAGVHALGGNPFRKNYAGVGFTYDENRDAFIPPKPYQTWELNEETCQWEPPVESPLFDPENPKRYDWDDTSVSWIEVQARTE